MSKNNTLADTAVSLVNSTKDENFKDIIRYKAIAFPCLHMKQI